MDKIISSTNSIQFDLDIFVQSSSFTNLTHFLSSKVNDISDYVVTTRLSINDNFNEIKTNANKLNEIPDYQFL